MPFLLQLIIALATGLLFGRGIRHSIPGFLRLKDRALPFSSPWLEIALAVFFGGTFWALDWQLGPWPYAVAMLLMTLAACDYLVKLIPDVLTLPATLFAIVWSGLDGSWILSHPGHGVLVQIAAPGLAGSWLAGAGLSLLGAAIGFLALETIRRTFGLLAGLEVMGLGDSKLALLIGALLGPIGVLMALPLGFCLGVAHGVACLRLTGQPHSPFGPPLALGAFVVLLTGDRLLRIVALAQQRILALPLELLAAIYTLLLSIAAGLIWRTRRKAREYEKMIEDDYREIEERLEP